LGGRPLGGGKGVQRKWKKGKIEKTGGGNVFWEGTLFQRGGEKKE